MGAGKQEIMSSFSYADLVVGQTASFRHALSRDHLTLFSELSGDTNPLHLDEAFAKDNGFPSVIAQGLLINSFFSRLVGVHLPGKHALILSVESQFRRPVFPEQQLTIEGVIKSKIDALKVIVLETTVSDDNGAVLVTGKLKVRVLC